MKIKSLKKLLEQVKTEGLSNPELNYKSCDKSSILKTGLSDQELDDVRQINISNTIALR